MKNPKLLLFSLATFPKLGKVLIFYSLIHSFTHSLNAQDFRLIRQFVKGEMVAVSVDNYSRVITADKQGNITAYDTSGNAQSTYSPRMVADVTQLEAWRSMQVLVFYRDLQQYTLLDRFLTPLSGYPYPARLPDDVGFARLMTPAYDEQLWIFDDSDFSLKKYNSQQQVVTLNSPLNLVLDAREYQINFMREYQNQLFINDALAGILVFDNLGNYRKKLSYQGLNYFQFSGDELYFLKNNQLYFYNLYTATERSVALPQKAQYALVTERFLFLFTKNGGYLYQR